jgi:hypothetical protein
LYNYLGEKSPFVCFGLWAMSYLICGVVFVLGILSPAETGVPNFRASLCIQKHEQI